jgi:hypothetical protein
MIRLADIITQHDDEFVERYAKDLMPSHRKALAAIKNCRNTFSPKMLLECENQQCAHQQVLPHSCLSGLSGWRLARRAGTDTVRIAKIMKRINGSKDNYKKKFRACIF